MGQALAAAERGQAQFAAGNYPAAVASLQSALQHHGKPSGVLENWLGLSYQEQGEHYTAIQHFTNALFISDGALDRINRGNSYLEANQCDLAIIDAIAALSMEPAEAPGFHTDVEANSMLSSCYAVNGEWTAALQHIDAAIAIAQEAGYPDLDMSALVDYRESLKATIP